MKFRSLIFVAISLMTACWLASCSSDEPVIDQEPEFDAILGGVKDGVIQVGDVESSLTDQILSGNVCLEAIDVQNFTRRVEESRWNFEKLESGCVQMESYSIPDKILFIDGKFVSKKEKKLVCNRWAYFNALELIQQVIPHHYTTYVEYPLQYDMTSRSLKSNVFNVQLLGAKAGQVMMAAEEIIILILMAWLISCCGSRSILSVKRSLSLKMISYLAPTRRHTTGWLPNSRKPWNYTLPSIRRTPRCPNGKRC